jgi:nucleotide-binding universal stress UspA family protein
VLVCTDGRSAATGAVRVGAALAARLGVAAHALAVVEPVPSYVPELVLPLPPDVEADRLAVTLESVRDQLARVAGGSVAWEVHAERGAPPYAITAGAAARDASLIVLGLGRHSPFDRVFGTETALRVLRLTERPVLAVTEDALALPRRAVAAIDFTPASVRAALTALDLLGPDATLTLVHARPFVRGEGPMVTDWEAAYMRRVEGLFARTVELLAERRADVRLESVTAVGDPADAVLDAAETRAAHLIAVGTHGAGFVERLILGSVSTAVLRRATCSVLACQQPGAADAARIERRLVGTSDSGDPAGWAELLADFSARNGGRPSRLEVDDPAVGAQLQAHGFAFLGAAHDRHDRRVVVMLGDASDRTRHLSRSIPHVAGLSVLAGEDGRDAVLRVAHGRG